MSTEMKCAPFLATGTRSMIGCSTYSWNPNMWTPWRTRQKRLFLSMDSYETSSPAAKPRMRRSSSASSYIAGNHNTDPRFARTGHPQTLNNISMCCQTVKPLTSWKALGNLPDRPFEAHDAVLAHVGHVLLGACAIDVPVSLVALRQQLGRQQRRGPVVCFDVGIGLLGVFHAKHELSIQGLARKVGQRDCCVVLGAIEALFEHGWLRNAREAVAPLEDRDTRSNGAAQPFFTIAVQVLYEACLDHDLHRRLAPLQLLQASGVLALLVDILLHALH